MHLIYVSDIQPYMVCASEPKRSSFSLCWKTQCALLPDSRSALFLSSPHLSSCETGTQKDNRITFSQDNICFAECIPDTGHRPAAGTLEAESLRFRRCNSNPRAQRIVSVSEKSFSFFSSWTLQLPPLPAPHRDKHKQNVFCLPQDCCLGIYSHSKLLSV